LDDLILEPTAKLRRASLACPKNRLIDVRGNWLGRGVPVFHL
jgi:hypothetical protein